MNTSSSVPFWVKPVVGIMLLAAILAIGPLLGLATAGGKVSPKVDRHSPTVNIEVVMSFVPRQFHRQVLSGLGVFAGRDLNNDRALKLRQVTQTNLDRLSHFYWVRRIEPMP